MSVAILGLEGDISDLTLLLSALARISQGRRFSLLLHSKVIVPALLAHDVATPSLSASPVPLFREPWEQAFTFLPLM